MSLGISIDSASAGSGIEATAAAAGNPGSTGTAESTAAPFGQWMAKALKLQGDQADMTGKTAETLPGLEQVGSQEDSSAPLEKQKTEDSGDDLALALPAWLQPWPGMPAVQQINVGPSLQAITASSTAPDANSVAAFAREQGLDADAIAWLMTPRTGQAASANGLYNPAVPSLALADTASAGTVQNTVSPAAGPAVASLPTPALPTVSVQAALAVSPIPGSWSLPQVSTAATPIGTGNGTAISAAPAGSSSADTGINDPVLQEASSTLLSQLRWGQQGKSANPLNTAPTLAAGATFTQQMAASRPSESALDLSAWLSAQGESEPANAEGQDTIEALPGSGAGAGMGDFSAAHRATSGPAHARAETTGPNASSSSLASDQMQQLSEQMADAIGERILREIERGHWNMRLMLKPAHLGHIEVEMRLRAGELDATFAAPHAVTRELLQDGLARLRDSLGQAGMDVANLHVKDGQNRQNGGDSTPGQRQFSNNAKDNAAGDAPVLSLESAPRPRRADGWDVMV